MREGCSAEVVSRLRFSCARVPPPLARRWSKRSVLGAAYVRHVACTRRQVLESLDNDACTLAEVASALGRSLREAEQGVTDCILRGWAVRSEYAADPRIPAGWAPYVMLTGEGEEALADMRGANA